MGGEERVQSQVLWHLIPHTAWTCGSSACVTHTGGPDSSAPAPLAILPGRELPATATCSAAFPHSTFLTAAQTSALELWASLPSGESGDLWECNTGSKRSGCKSGAPSSSVPRGCRWLWPGLTKVKACGNGSPQGHSNEPVFANSWLNLYLCVLSNLSYCWPDCVVMWRWERRAFLSARRN